MKRSYLLVAMLLVGVGCWTAAPVSVKTAGPRPGTPLIMGTSSSSAVRYYRAIPVSVTPQKIDDTGTTLELIPAVVGKKIQVWGGELNLGTSTTMEFKSATTSLTGAQTLVALRIDPPVGRPGVDCAVPWKETAVGEAFNVVLGASAKITGELVWTSNE